MKNLCSCQGHSGVSEHTFRRENKNTHCNKKHIEQNTWKNNSLNEKRKHKLIEEIPDKQSSMRKKTEKQTH